MIMNGTDANLMEKNPSRALKSRINLPRLYRQYMLLNFIENKFKGETISADNKIASPTSNQGLFRRSFNHGITTISQLIVMGIDNIGPSRNFITHHWP